MLGKEEMPDSEALPSHLTCPICFDIFKDPVFACGNPCQHVFCRPCIETALKTSPKCPVCRVALPSKNLKSHQFVRNMLDDTVVRCRFKCGWVGRYQERQDHSRNCPGAAAEKELKEVKARLQAAEDRHRRIEASKVELRKKLEALDEEADEALNETLSLTRKCHELEAKCGGPRLESQPAYSPAPRIQSTSSLATASASAAAAATTDQSRARRDSPTPRTPPPAPRPQVKAAPTRTGPVVQRQFYRPPISGDSQLETTSYEPPIVSRRPNAWNEFQHANRGKGWTRQQFSEEWKKCKEERARAETNSGRLL